MNPNYYQSPALPIQFYPQQPHAFGTPYGQHTYPPGPPPPQMINPQFMSPPIYETNIPNVPINGWYRPASQPLPPETPPQSSQTVPNSNTEEPPGEPKIHDFWQRLLAPLPGKSTPPNLLQVTTTVSKAIAIQAPPIAKSLRQQRQNDRDNSPRLSESGPALGSTVLLERESHITDQVRSSTTCHSIPVSPCFRKFLNSINTCAALLLLSF